MPLPPHQLIFNAIGDADLCEPALQAAVRLIARSRAPVINDPARGDENRPHRQCQAAPRRAGRGDAADHRHRRATSSPAPTASPHWRDTGLTFPLLLRSPGYHTGRNFILVEQAAELAGSGGQPSGRRTAGDRISRCPRQGRQRAQIPRDDDRRPDLSAASGDIEQMESALFHLRHGRQAGSSPGGSGLPRRYAGRAGRQGDGGARANPRTRSASTMPASISGSVPTAICCCSKPTPPW